MIVLKRLLLFVNPSSIVIRGPSFGPRNLSAVLNLPGIPETYREILTLETGSG